MIFKTKQKIQIYYILHGSYMAEKKIKKIIDFLSSKKDLIIYEKFIFNRH